jgi:protein-disulfide isomerase
VQVVWKNLPLSMHKEAAGAARAAMAAAQQGKFWEFHDKLFANQSSLNSSNYLKYARELGLDLGKFGRDMDPLTGIVGKQIEADKAEAESLGVTGTPAFFVNGRYLSGAKPFEDFAKVIDAELVRLKLPVPKVTAGS